MLHLLHQWMLLCAVCRTLLAIDTVALLTALLWRQWAEESLRGGLYHSHADHWSHALCLSSLSAPEAQACLVTHLVRFISMTAAICFSLAHIFCVTTAWLHGEVWRLHIANPQAKKCRKRIIFPYLTSLVAETEPLSSQNFKSFLNLPFWLPAFKDRKA